MSSEPDIDDYPFRHRLRVRYVEVDAQAVVYNSHYLMYYDVGITEFLRRYAFNQVEHAAATGHDFQLVTTTVNYLRAIRYDTEIDIAVALARIGNSSLLWKLAIFSVPEAVPLSTGEIVWVYTNLADERSVPVPDELRQRFSASP